MVNPSPQQRESLFQRLAEIVGARNASADDDVTTRYQIDGLTPSIVISAADVEQISQVIQLCNQYQAGIVPWGGGTKQPVGPPLSRADVVLDLKPMHKIVELDISNFTVQVEAGIINGELQKQLAGERVFLPYDPPDMETSTIGGELATNASGPLRAEYGTTRDIVLGVTAVTPTGDVVHTGGKTMKNVAGIDLCKLLIGSWGTLGIMVLTCANCSSARGGLWALSLMP
jgi:FAD/FMN-containing dehydrogenase